MSISTQIMKQVKFAIETELEYQNLKYGESGSSDEPGDGSRSIDEFAVYIQEYTNQLVHICGTSINPTEKLNAVRKIAALCISCMNQHGAPIRIIEEEDDE